MKYCLPTCNPNYITFSYFFNYNPINYYTTPVNCRHCDNAAVAISLPSSRGNLHNYAPRLV